MFFIINGTISFVCIVGILYAFQHGWHGTPEKVGMTCIIVLVLTVLFGWILLGSDGTKSTYYHTIDRSQCKVVNGRLLYVADDDVYITSTYNHVHSFLTDSTAVIRLKRRVNFYGITKTSEDELVVFIKEDTCGKAK